MDTMEALHTRRSVRRFDPRPVDEPTITALFEAARWAPSWANTQCARWTLVADPELKRSLVGTFSERNPATAGAMEAPLLLALSAVVRTSGYKRGAVASAHGDAWTFFDAGLAAHQLTLAAHALGLGTVHVGSFDPVSAARLLELPADEIAIELLPLGWPAETPVAPKRRPTSEILRRR